MATRGQPTRTGVAPRHVAPTEWHHRQPLRHVQGRAFQRSARRVARQPVEYTDRLDSRRPQERRLVAGQVHDGHAVL